MAAARRRQAAALDLDEEVRLRLATDGPTAYALRMPVPELVEPAREDDVVGHLGPDLLGPAWDEDEALRRRRGDPDRPVVEAVLDQRNLAGIGDLWAVETCSLRGGSPWTPARDMDRAAFVQLARRMMRHSLDHPGHVTTGHRRRGRTHWVYGRAERPGRRCGTRVGFRDSGRVPGRHRGAVRAGDLVVPTQPARAGPARVRPADPTRPASRGQRGELRLAQPAAVRRTRPRARSAALGLGSAGPGRMTGMEPVRGQVVTVFRSRLRLDGAQEYAGDAAGIAELARSAPGYVEHKVFTAEDGERVTLVTFADEASHRGWRDHPEHRAAQRRGLDRYYETYSIQVGTTTYASGFVRGAGA